MIRIMNGSPRRLLRAARVLVVLLEARTNGRTDGSGVARRHQDPSDQGRGGHGALGIPAPRAGTRRWHLPERQALAEGATPIAKGQPRWLRTVLALLQASGADSGLAGGELLLDRTSCVGVESRL